MLKLCRGWGEGESQCPPLYTTLFSYCYLINVYFNFINIIFLYFITFL